MINKMPTMKNKLYMHFESQRWSEEGWCLSRTMKRERVVRKKCFLLNKKKEEAGSPAVQWGNRWVWECRGGTWRYVRWVYFNVWWSTVLTCVTDCLISMWNSPAYAFFEPRPTISDHKDYQCLEFKCVASQCKRQESQKNIGSYSNIWILKIRRTASQK